jgi:hypothetical protein
MMTTNINISGQDILVALDLKVITQDEARHMFGFDTPKENASE